MHVASVYDALQRLPELETVAELKRKAVEPDNVPPPKRARSTFTEKRNIVRVGSLFVSPRFLTSLSVR